MNKIELSIEYLLTKLFLIKLRKLQHSFRGHQHENTAEIKSTNEETKTRS